MNVPSISVVVPAYNAAGTIEEALHSVLAQTRPPTEIIVVDDASTDDTVAKLHAFTERVPNLRIVEQPENGGPARARNAGIEAATGEWIAFLDGDDAWLSHRLDVQLQAAGRAPDVVLWCGDVVPFEGEAVTGSGPPAEPRLMAREAFVSHNAVATSTVLVMREALNRVGAFDPQFRGPEDYDLWMRLATVGPMMHLPVAVSRYRHVAGSLSMDERTFLPEVLRVLDKAFGPGGALADLGERRCEAVANQYWNASWMAYQRGDRRAALQYWWRAYRRDHRSAAATGRPWWPLLWRYLFGRRADDT